MNRDLLLTPLELSQLKGNEWLEGRWFYDPYKVMEAQLDKVLREIRHIYTINENLDITSLGNTEFRAMVMTWIEAILPEKE